MGEPTPTPAPAPGAQTAYPYRQTPCDFCSRPVIWALTKNLRLMPVDPAPDAAGNVVLTPQPGGRPLATVLGPADRDRDGLQLRMPHVATCPFREVWSRRGLRPPAPVRVRDRADLRWRR